MNKLAPILLILLLVCSGCVKKQIKAALYKKHTYFEIVEVKKDSANVYDAINRLRSLEILASQNNLKIVTALSDLPRGASRNTRKQCYLYTDSLLNRMIELCNRFEASGNKKYESCYYVKYKAPVLGNMVVIEDYFYIDPHNKDVLSRPCDWNQFLIEQEYSKLLEEVSELKPEILKLKQ